MEKYRVLRKIGAGASGSAYLVCKRTAPEHQLVLKKVCGAADQALKEATLLSRLNHPFVLRYIDHFEYKSWLCIVTEYCTGGDLHQHLRSEACQGHGQLVPEPQVLEWFVQMVMALQHMHTCHNTVHRDLKTANVFVCEGARIVKLGDFGIARSLQGTLDMAKTCVGTPYYMSPEVLQGQPYAYASDMWSLGACLYEMMARRHAFDACDLASLMARITSTEHAPLPAGYSPELQGLLSALLSRDPGLRPTATTILALPFLLPTVQRMARLAADQGMCDASVAHTAIIIRPSSMERHVPTQVGSRGDGNQQDNGTPITRDAGATGVAAHNLKLCALPRAAVSDLERHLPPPSADPPTPGAILQRMSVSDFVYAREARWEARLKCAPQPQHLRGHQHAVLNPCASASCALEHSRNATAMVKGPTLALSQQSQPPLGRRRPATREEQLRVPGFVPMQAGAAPSRRCSSADAPTAHALHAVRRSTTTNVAGSYGHRHAPPLKAASASSLMGCAPSSIAMHGSLGQQPPAAGVDVPNDGICAGLVALAERRRAVHASVLHAYRESVTL